MAAYDPPPHDYTSRPPQSTANEQGRRYSQLDPRPNRSREHSTARSESVMPEHPRLQTQPIKEAVGNAFQSDVPPELIAQITQSVLNQLKTSGMESSAATPVPPPSAKYPPPPPLQQPMPQSPSTASASSPPMPTRVFTPPSPHKHTDYPSHGSPSSQSGVFPAPTHSPQEPRSPIREPQTSSFYERRTSSPLSQSSESSNARPKGPARLSTMTEETTLEKIWGQLFNEAGRPTPRLGQFLRGLAVHIIEDYEPRQSIVITPDKMIQYYKDVKLADERYPWSTVFDDEHSSISRMYRDLECQHHLVQEHLDERPDIPGLTPVGFQQWATLLIQAHPKEEFERLQKAALAMPINNPDEKKERFPKELSRRLFPGSEDKQVRERIEKAISLHANVDLPLRPNNRETSPKGASHKPSASDASHLPSRRDSTTNGENVAPPYAPSNIERERKPYSRIPESTIDDTNPTPVPPSNPIERERKPYSAQPGGGKQFEDDRKAQESTKTRADSTSVKPQRSESNARVRPVPLNQGPPDSRRGSEMPRPEIPHPQRAPSNAGRHRSPSFSNDYRRSDGDLRGYPPTFQPGSLPTEGFEDEAARRYARDRADRARRQAEEDGRSYGESPSSRRYDRGVDINGPAPHRGSYLSNNEEDYYRPSGRAPGNGYDYQQPYGGPVYR
ncbi:MAG: hypothetical protein LQ339_003915 [Xanthoria mediterranea]|nr:MAG: hypothetical protein LQ339_003915 [Xanthoria mediterranea]